MGIKIATPDREIKPRIRINKKYYLGNDAK